MNAVMQRWIQSCRHELLDRMLIWNQPHLRYALRQHKQHDNAHRPHSGITSSRPMRPPPEPISRRDQLTRPRVQRRDRLGGILHEHEHEHEHAA
jgi:hypothetical protein